MQRDSKGAIATQPRTSQVAEFRALHGLRPAAPTPQLSTLWWGSARQSEWPREQAQAQFASDATCPYGGGGQVFCIRKSPAP